MKKISRFKSFCLAEDSSEKSDRFAFTQTQLEMNQLKARRVYKQILHTFSRAEEKFLLAMTTF